MQIEWVYKKSLFKCFYFNNNISDKFFNDKRECVINRILQIMCVFSMKISANVKNDAQMNLD